MIAALVFTVASLHLNDSREYQQINPGIGVEWAIDDVTRAGVGAYRNSSSRLSMYGTVSRQKDMGRFSVGLELGAVTGYKWPVLPLVFPFATVAIGRWQIKANVLPTTKPIVGFQVKRVFQ